MIYFCRNIGYQRTLPNKLLNINENYTGFGASAMDSVLSTGILRGRPFGGTAVLLKNDLLGAVSNILTFDKVTSITICDLLLINVYLPCEDVSINALNLLHETFANVIDVIEDSNADYIIFGGDMNVDFNSKTPHSLVVNDFLETYKIVFDKLLNMNDCRRSKHRYSIHIL